MSVLDAVRGELAGLPERVRDSGLGATAVVLAERLDEAALRDTSAIARELRAVLSELRELARLAPVEADPLDELERRRAARLADSSPQKRAAGGEVLGPRGGRPRGKRRDNAGPGTG